YSPLLAPFLVGPCFVMLLQFSRVKTEISVRIETRNVRSIIESLFGSIGLKSEGGWYMGQILILGNPSVERSGLALFMEFAGHQCTEVDSVTEAVKLLGKNAYDLVLADALVGDADTEKIVKTLKTASPKTNVMILAEDGASAMTIDDVI